MNYDRQWLNAPDTMNLVVNICPFARGGELGGVAEEELYLDYVTKTVERYDGDGDLGCTEEAPDCYRAGDQEYPSQEVIDRFQANPIKFWQVCNQVTDACEGEDCRDTYAVKYARVQEITYKGVKTADDAAAVLIAGDSASDMYPAVFKALKGNYIDIVDYHRFGKELIYDPQKNFDYLKDSLSKAGFDLNSLRFWITETGGSFTLPGVSSSQVEITRVVPEVESGLEVKDADYLASFTTEMKEVKNEAVELILGPTPVIIVER